MSRILIIKKKFKCVLLWSYKINSQYKKMNKSTIIRSKTWNICDSFFLFWWMRVFRSEFHVNRKSEIKIAIRNKKNRNIELDWLIIWWRIMMLFLKATVPKTPPPYSTWPGASPHDNTSWKMFENVENFKNMHKKSFDKLNQSKWNQFLIN